MIKFLYTVGTTPFSRLTNKIINKYDSSENDIYAQTASDEIVKYIKHVKFTSNFEEKLFNYDLVITHAGAGSIYSLLEKSKKIIVVPNLDRDDKHQYEIAKFVEMNGLGIVCWNPDEISDSIRKSLVFNPKVYIKQKFYKVDEILEFINEI